MTMEILLGMTHLVFSGSTRRSCDWCLVWYILQLFILSCSFAFNFQSKIPPASLYVNEVAYPKNPCSSCWTEICKKPNNLQPPSRNVIFPYSGLSQRFVKLWHQPKPYAICKPCNSGIFCQLDFNSQRSFLRSHVDISNVSRGPRGRNPTSFSRHQGCCWIRRSQMQASEQSLFLELHR